MCVCVCLYLSVDQNIDNEGHDLVRVNVMTFGVKIFIIHEQQSIFRVYRSDCPSELEMAKVDRSYP